MGKGLGGIVKAVVNPIGAINSAVIGKSADPIGNMILPGSPKTGASSGVPTNFDTAGQPIWSGVANEQGNLDPRYALNKQADITMDQRAANAIRDRGLATGDSAWAQMAKQQQGLNNQAQLAQAQNQSATQVAQNRNNLAMRGGVAAGARERLAKSAGRDLMMRNQDIANQNNQANLNIGMQDEQSKVAALQSVAGYDRNNAELADKNRQYSTDIDQMNRATLLGDVEGRRNFNMDIFKQNMALKGANATAQAQMGAAKSGKGGGILGK